jgi:acetyl esterase/lipase
MASPEFVAFQARMAAQPPPPAPAGLQEVRARIDATMGTLPLATGTVSEDVDGQGVGGILCARSAGADDPMVVYLHGGGYRMGSALAWRSYGSHLADACRARVLLVDYRLAPEHPFPAAVDDAMAAYRWVLGAGTPPARVVVAGDSAGGGLAAALLLSAKADSVPVPAGGVCLSPWADLTNSADSYRTRSATDQLFSLTSAVEAARLYLGAGDPRDPQASPVFGDWSGLPPLLIQVGDTEVLLDDAANLAAAARRGGVDVTHHVYPDMPHVWQLQYPAFPESVEAVDEIGRFIERVTA